MALRAKAIEADNLRRDRREHDQDTILERLNQCILYTYNDYMEIDCDLYLRIRDEEMLNDLDADESALKESEGTVEDEQ